jgi:putative endonuclease
MKTGRDTGHSFGLRAEMLAVWLLRVKGYRILARRYRTPVGEVDIIARRAGTLVFVEVKARAALADALQCLSPRGQDRITRAAQCYLAAHPSAAAGNMRFDFIALAPPLRWRHLDNAWRVPT